MVRNTPIVAAKAAPTWLILLCVFAALFAVFLVFSLPNFSATRRAMVRGFAHWDYAHRGLWSAAEGIPENSMPAFERAVAAGYGIELDVHLTRDNQLVVFHDSTLARMCGMPGKVEEMNLAELKKARLSGTEYGIPLLSDVLAMVDGRVPLLVEIKTPSLDVSICPVLKKKLDSYGGRFLIESFNPYALRWFRRNAPGVLRGQLSTRKEKETNINRFALAAVTALVVNILGRPDFVAYNHRAKQGIGIRLHRHVYHTPAFAWTVRDASAYPALRAKWDATIFEGFLPPNPPTVMLPRVEMILPDGDDS